MKTEKIIQHRLSDMLLDAKELAKGEKIPMHKIKFTTYISCLEEIIEEVNTIIKEQKEDKKSKN